VPSRLDFFYGKSSRVPLAVSATDAGSFVLDGKKNP
jgi:hypothetical protein